VLRLDAMLALLNEYTDHQADPIQHGPSGDQSSTPIALCHNGRERRQAADGRSGERGKSRNIGSIHGRFHVSQFTVMSAAENVTQATMPLGPDRKSGSLQGT